MYMYCERKRKSEGADKVVTGKLIGVNKSGFY